MKKTPPHVARVVHRLYNLGVSKTKIAYQTNLHRNTVYKIIRYGFDYLEAKEGT